LHLAMDRLESIDFVGLTEDIGAVVSTMAQEMNYHPALYFPFINEDQARIDSLQAVSAEELEILREHNSVDLQLYDFAQQLIERRVFERNMAQLLRSGVYSVPPGSFEIPISGIMPGSGWYAPERDGSTYWRWTGPDRYFTIEVPLRHDKSYRLIMTCGSSRPIGRGDLGAKVNDAPITIELLPEGNSYRCQFVIPRTLLAQSSGFCRIRFDARETTRLTHLDIRALGVSVRQIVFECLDPDGVSTRPNSLNDDVSA